ncbi:chromosome segregation protein SMC [Allohahella marinimesophila]|uniref:Chromosome partition protein Smc n=1 Tax=Allohahella marinimesophila TaxID=1054972 RepID=A0ABP7QB91_9GAMM
MRLKSIKLAGFKSFVDPTTVRFPGNMSAIVGPNGCGKSNIIDAVRWVMGESSAKHLRGESMADVIFNGSTARKPVSQASIELIFDNCLGRVTGAFAQYDELAVRRMVTRDGVSAYYINGQKTRKRDLTDLFLGTGLGPRSYAIIEQGMISRLVESKPEDLRVFVEEAAGISKYKERRKDTESRIHRTRENLERLQDVRDELGKQLQSLQRQARNAARYLEYKASAKQAEARLAAIRWQQHQARAEQLSASVEAYNDRIKDRLLGRQATEASLSAGRERLSALHQAIDAGQAAFYGASGEVAECEQALNSRTRERSTLQRERETLALELAALGEEIEREQVQLEELLEEQEAIVEAIEVLAETVHEASAERQAHSQTLRSEQYTLTEMQTRRRELQREAELKQSLQQQSERLLAQLEDQLEQARVALQQDNDDQGDERALVLRGQLAAAQARIEEVEQALEDTQTQIAALRTQLEEVRREGQLQQQKQQAAETETRMLEQLEKDALKRQSGSIRDWIEKAQKAGLTLTPLRQLVKADPAWEHCIEALLQQRLSGYHIDSHETLQGVDPALLANLPAGLVLTTAKAASDAVIDQPNAAFELKAPAGVLEWLQGARPAGGLHSALADVAQLGAGEYFCTVDGVTVGRSWICADTVGASSADSSTKGATDSLHGALGRQRRLASLQVEVEAGQMGREAADSAFKSLQSELDRLEAAQREFNQVLRETGQEESRLKTSQTALEESRKKAEAARDRARQQIESIQEKQAREEAHRQSCKVAWSDALQSLDTLIPELDALQSDVTTLQQQHDSAASEVRQQEIRLQELRLAQEGLKGRVGGLQTSLAKSQQAEARGQAQLAQMSQTLEKAQQSIPELEAALPGLLEIRNQQEQALAKLRATLSELESDIREENTRYGSLDEELQSLRGEQEKQRLELVSLQHGMQTQIDVLDRLDESLGTQLELLANDELEVSDQAGLEQSLMGELRQTEERIQKLGAINLAAVEEYEAQQQRAEYLQAQQEDLETALTTLEDAIRKIDRETRQKFRETYDAINEGLQQLFPKVFGGGEAYLELTGDDLLNTGIAIMARPPGKKNSTIHLLSGGEKALTAIALVFAIFRLNPAPFCMLDEVDAPLDDANVLRYSNIVKEMSEHVQFIYISHNKIAMERADHLLGVTMHEAGVSRMVAVDVEAALAMVEEAG